MGRWRIGSLAPVHLQPASVHGTQLPSRLSRRVARCLRRSQLLEDSSFQSLGIVPFLLGHASHALVGGVHGSVTVSPPHFGAVALFVLSNGSGLHPFEPLFISHSASSFQGRDGLLHRSHQGFQFLLPRAQCGKMIDEHPVKVEIAVVEGRANVAQGKSAGSQQQNLLQPLNICRAVTTIAAGRALGVQQPLVLVMVQRPHRYAGQLRQRTHGVRGFFRLRLWRLSHAWHFGRYRFCLCCHVRFSFTPSTFASASSQDRSSRLAETSINPHAP